MRKICTIIFIILPIVGCKGNVAPLPSLAINYITESGVLPPGGIILLSVSVNAPTTATLSYSWATSNGFNIATDTHKMTVAVVTPYTYGTTGTATVTVTYAGSSYPFTASSIRMDTQAVTGPITHHLRLHRLYHPLLLLEMMNQWSPLSGLSIWVSLGA